MTSLDDSPAETLQQDENVILSRGRGTPERIPILVVTPVEARPSPGNLERLRHEFSLKDELDPAWALVPIALDTAEGGTRLTLRDPGGILLERLLGKPWELGEFLRAAIAIAGALAEAHARGLVHKDIRPANILLDAAAGRARLTGFGIATRLVRQRQDPEPPEVLAGTLAYMAPEQTGRMNRSIDSRSDLYSLGVTLYQMLTGALPFAASDPMEWVHCHVARVPVPPAERDRRISAQVSDILMKLLSKPAEERYQTALGLQTDLKRCLAEWEAGGGIGPFPLAGRDASPRLLIPERLYGREAETRAVFAAFERVVAEGTPELVLVTGYSGIGKSSVVLELHKALLPPRGLFASGKFESLKRDVPYAALAQALQGLVRALLVRSEAELGAWREAFRQALGQNGRVVADLVPDLELVAGRQAPVEDLPPIEAQNRFRAVFTRFLGVFARPEHPLVLFLDDLQWLDVSTLGLLEHLAAQPELRHLLLIGAYRDNEVGPSHPLSRTLEAIRKAGTKVREVVLGPLSPGDTERLVGDSLQCGRERSRPLARLVQKKTAGNPFFANQFLASLAEEGLLTFDPGAMAWTWDLARIQAKGYTDNVVDLMVGKLGHFPDAARESLKTLACLGNRADASTLAALQGLP